MVPSPPVADAETMDETMARAMGGLILAVALAGCGGEGGPRDEPETVAPLCSMIAGADPRELFAVPVIPTDSVIESLIFGGMDPGTLEPINFELGFRLEGTNVPVVAPADLYLRSIEYTRYVTGLRAGMTDYGMAFHVCAVEGPEGEIRSAVEGDFQHITSLSPELQAIIDTYDFDCFLDDANPDEVAEKCSFYFPPSLDEDGLILAAGTVIGGAGGTGDNDYTPGFDFNLLDTRSENAFVNRDRIGAEEGPGRSFRYGACVYEYFAEPHRSAYMAAVGQNGDARISASDPCGTLEFGQAGTAAGIWTLESAADLGLETRFVEVLESLLVLAPHPVFPESQQVISSEMVAITEVDGHPVLAQIEPAGDADVNPSFYEMVPGPIYCLESEGFGFGSRHAHFMQLGPGAETLIVETLSEGCAATPQESRDFGPGAMTFVR